jgi:tetratricopeptide (TPR) repeat protein
MSRRITKVSLLLAACALASLAGCAGLPQKEASSTIEGEIAAALETEVAEEGKPRGVFISETETLSTKQRDAFHAAAQLLRENRPDDAVALLEPLVAEQPQVTAPYINLGKAYSLSGDKEKAEATLKQALQLSDGHPLATQELALLLRRSGRFNEARSISEASLALYPDYLPLRKNLGILCAIYLNDTTCALKQFEYVLELQPENAKVKLWISEIKLR